MTTTTTTPANEATMTTTTTTTTFDAATLAWLRQQAQTEIIGRDAEVVMLIVGLITGLNVALIGPPGVAKTHLAETVGRLATGKGATSTWQLHPMSTVDEILGGMDPGAAIKGQLLHRVEKSILDPALRVAVIDEVFKATNALFGAMLRLLQDGTVRGIDNVDYPAHALSFVGLSNEFPAGTCGTRKRAGDLDNAALWDRFQIRGVVSPLQGGPLRDVIRAVKGSHLPRATASSTLQRRGARPVADSIQNPDGFWNEAFRRHLEIAGKVTGAMDGRVAKWADTLNQRGVYVSNRMASGVFSRAAAGHALLHGRHAIHAADWQWAARTVAYDGPESLSIICDSQVMNLLVPDVSTAILDAYSDLVQTAAEVGQWTDGEIGPAAADPMIRRVAAARGLLQQFTGNASTTTEEREYLRAANNEADQLAVGISSHLVDHYGGDLSKALDHARKVAATV